MTEAHATQLTNHRIDVERLCACEGEVIATAIERVSRLDDHAAFAARVTRYLETANDTFTEEESVMKTVLCDDVFAELLKIVLGQ
jgi:hypothetical protein